jgi:membrane-bound lytic murein transglycosylase A
MPASSEARECSVAHGLLLRPAPSAQGPAREARLAMAPGLAARLMLTIAIALGGADCASAQTRGEGWPDARPDARGDTLRPDLASDSLEGLSDAIDAQCALPRPPTGWPALCEEWRRERGNLAAWLARRFEPRLLRSPDGADRGLITGYYEPELRASRERESPGQMPLLRRPAPDWPLARQPRAQIEAGTEAALAAGLVLAWVDDPVDAFLLHIQGSGRLRLRDGSVMRVGYAGDNGHAYRAIGRDLIERGAIAPQAISAQAIASWLRAYPAEGRELMQRNARYVYFRETAPAARDALAGRDGPAGSLGVALTPLRSVAVDPRAIPPGSLLWLEAEDPRGGMLRRLVVAQDTGAAIVGVPRADLYWGTGAVAGDSAGLMKGMGRLWLLQPRP